MRLFDTHTHLCDAQFDPDRDAVITRMREAHVDRALVIGCAPEPSDAFALADAHDFLCASVGVHPHEASEWCPERADRVTRWMAHPKAVAVGEIGLDFHYDFSPRDIQRQAFEDQMDIALALDKPVILHIREAHGEATDRLVARHRSGRLPRGVMHCYTGSWESAKQYLNMGFYISLTGTVTFKNAPKVWTVAKNVPLDRLLIETDCPYMAPAPMRGRRNEPAYVRYVAERIAELRGEDTDVIAEATFKNGLRAFDMP